MIKYFMGVNSFLSNFEYVPLVVDGIHYCSVENAFQASKTHNFASKMIFATITPQEAKYRGRDIELRNDWEDVKLHIMKDLLKLKFSQPHFKQLLLETGNKKLVEGNYWGDTFWGVDTRTGKGENNLGKLLMEVRMELNA